MREIQRVAVVGAGTMGAQIAAHCTNAGLSVLLLDLKTEFVQGALKKLASLKPAPFAHPDFVHSIEVGNFTDDLGKLASVDLIIEAVVEDLRAKQELLGKVAPHLAPDTLLSSNTSGVFLQEIAGVLPETAKPFFMGTHFFNPPRYLRLLEMTPIRETSKEAFGYLQDFCTRRLGKHVVVAKDTPDFIANRIGVMGIMQILQTMRAMDLSIEEVDKLTGKAIGWPPSATFRTLDMVGLDVFVHVVEYLYEHIPADEFRDRLVVPDFVKTMVARGLLGEKSGSGFYKKVRGENGESQILVIDPTTLAYRPQQKVKFQSVETGKNMPDTGERIKFLLDQKDPAAEFLRRTLLFTIEYATARTGEIAHCMADVDEAMRYGFGWELGPYEILDTVGPDVFERNNLPTPDVVQQIRPGLGMAHRKLLRRPTSTIDLADLKRRGKERAANSDASLIDLGEGVACLEFHSKMNALGHGAIAMLMQGAKLVAEHPKWKGLVIANQEEHFSVGANLDIVYQAILNDEFDEIDALVRAFQGANMLLKYMPKPVVAAPFGYTFGGGLEVCLHTDRVCASIETYAGLVEFGVGVIPAGGGTTQMLVRNLALVPDAMPAGATVSRLPFVQRALETIGMAKVSTSAFEARDLGYLREGDIVVMQKDRLIEEAKAQVLALAPSYQPPRRKLVTLYGETIYASLRVGLDQWRKGGFITDYDFLLGEKLAEIMTGGELSSPTQVPEQYLLDAERKAFLYLCGQKKTQERIAHMLKHGKPLRN